MNERDEPYASDDELVSLVLDGEAAPDDVARVANDPLLTARLAEFRAVAARVGAPVEPPTPAKRDVAIAAALAAATEAAGAARSGAVADLDQRRSARRQRVLAVAGLAALLLVALLAVPFVARLTDTNSDNSSSALRAANDAATTTAAGGGQSSAEATNDAGATAPATPLTALPAVADLGAVGSFDNTTALGAGVRGVLASRNAAPTTTVVTQSDAADFAAETECAAVQAQAADPPLGALTAVGSATVAGQPVQVFVYIRTDGNGLRMVLVSEGTCLPFGEPADV
jgi:hypothetical protein